MNVLGSIRPDLATADLDLAVQRREGGLLRFAIAITVLNVLGHVWLGFEQSWATPFVALAASYATELAGEWANAWSLKRPARFTGSSKRLVRFLLSAHITGLAVGMLLYAAEQLWVIAFAASAAVASKYVFRVPTASSGAKRHFLNPSNFGIAVALLLFPTVGIAPPYQFAENISGALDWLIPSIIVCTGTLLNWKFTGRLPLIGAWLCAFALQAIVRATLHGAPVAAGLAPITGFAFILFTFYMVTDPATTPDDRREQWAFGSAVGFAYGLLVELHVVFGLFFALVAVSTARGALLLFHGWIRVRRMQTAEMPVGLANAA
ncbi:MAG: enediyne biosynthesis protein [Sphingomonadales bacterium]|jgi:hypothetical protein|nr:enediyne biosynthesis protein [Sphingomonadales bacterium]